MRPVIVAANWKMHTTPADAGDLAETIAARTRVAGVIRVFCPPFVCLAAVRDALAELVRVTAEQPLVLGVGHGVDPVPQRLPARAGEQVLEQPPVFQRDDLPARRAEHAAQPVGGDHRDHPVTRLAVHVDDPDDLAEFGHAGVDDGLPDRALVEFGVAELKKTKWALVHSTDAFGTNGAKSLEGALVAKGHKPTLIQGYTNQAADFSAVVLAIRQSGADVVGSYFTFESDLGIFARQLRQLGVRVPWVGSPSIVNTTALNLAGPALHGTYGVADYAVDATPASKAFAERYQALHKALPDNQSSWAFDAVNLLALAINAAGSTEPEAVRAALAGVRGYQGAEGEYNYDERGDGLRGYNIVRNDGGKVVFDRRIEFKD